MDVGEMCIRDRIESGEVGIDPGAEDIHTFVEQRLTERLGVTGKKLHTARSRNAVSYTHLDVYKRQERIRT